MKTNKKESTILMPLVLAESFNMPITANYKVECSNIYLMEFRIAFSNKPKKPHHLNWEENVIYICNNMCVMNFTERPTGENTLEVLFPKEGEISDDVYDKLMHIYFIKEIYRQMNT